MQTKRIAPHLTLVIFLLAVILAGPPISLAQAAQFPATPDPHVKADFLYKFALFVEWPFERYYAQSAPFVIGVLGDDQVFSDLENTMAGKTIRRRDVRVRRFGAHQNFADCHILFIGSPLKNQMDMVFHHLRGAPVLTVGDSPEFLKAGGIIRLFADNHRVRFEINTDAATRAGLRVSSKFLAEAWLTTDDRRAAGN